MSERAKTIQTVITGIIASKSESAVYPREHINAAKDVMKYISKLTYKDFAEIKRSFK